MKINFSFLSVAFFILFSVEKIAAQNLVPNPSFEEHTNCPDNLAQLYDATDWTINLNSADYFNSCALASSVVSVPQSGFGIQYAATGNAYAGFYGLVQLFPEANEFFGSQLLTPLVIGQKYFVSFKVSLADGSPDVLCGINGIGILFTNKFYGDTSIPAHFFLNNYATVFSSVIITDTSNWTIISGSFIADSSYKYFMIGHFFDQAHTNVICLDTTNIDNHWSYYFVDDVCVSPDSLECDLNPEGVYNLPQQQIAIYPNPATDKVEINFLSPTIVRSIEMFDLLGRKIMDDEWLVNNSNHYSLNTKNFPRGYYFIRINTSEGIINRKIVLQ